MTKQAQETLKKLEALDLNRATLRQIRTWMYDLEVELLQTGTMIAQKQVQNILTLIAYCEKETYPLNERITP